MLAQRLITGPLLIAGLLGLVWLDTVIADHGWSGGLVLLAVFAGLLIPLASWEAATLMGRTGIRVPRILAMVLAWWLLGTACVAGCMPDPQLAIGIALLGPAVALGVALVGAAWGRRIEGAWTSASGLVGIAIWTGLLPAFWVLAAREHSAWLVAGLVLVVKMGDIGAYFTGRFLGRHKMIPWLSPGKTMEGLAGGLILGGLAGLVLSMVSETAEPQNQLNLLVGVIGGVALAFLGALGDLAESLLKRAADAKDSGRLLPGMGGVLDVLDSPLATGPVAFLMVSLGTGG